MKRKLSIKEKARRYDEALDRARKVFNCVAEVNVREPGTVISEYIFPEVNENNKDKKIRKRLIKLIEILRKIGFFELHEWKEDEMLDWIKKQG